MSGVKLFGIHTTAGNGNANRNAGPDKVVPTGMGVRVKAHSGNAGIVFVGEAGAVTTDDSPDGTGGYPLSANEDVLVWVKNLNQIGIVANGAGNVVSFLVEQ